MTGFAVGAGSLWAGCTTDRERAPGGGREAGRHAEQDPDIAVAAEVLVAEQSVLDALTAVVDRHPDLAPMLSPLTEAHRAHTTLLAEAAPDRPPTASPGPTATSSPTPFTVPTRPQSALRRLATLERDLSTTDKRHAFAAQSGAFARLLASIAASAAQHGVVLLDHAENQRGRG